MANKKKKTNGKKNNVKQNTIKKVNKPVEVKNEETDKEKDIKQIKEFIVVALIIAVVFIVVYLLTLGANKIGWFDPHYTKPAVSAAEISYEDILAGTILTRSDYEYYVAIADFEEDFTMYLESLIDDYRKKEGALTLYTVDLSEGLNSYLISKESSTLVNNVKDLKINDQTLLHIKNGKVTESFVGIDNIETVLK